ncbi:MAG: hypothetical protein IJR00_07220 [Lachnospiraceae bacterium]|nr:hypothetical protein [Lachnospiraceae bacterium]
MNTKGKVAVVVFYILLAALFIRLVTLDGESNKRLEEESRWQEQAMKNAERYILEKYGVQAEAVDVEFEYIISPVPVISPRKKTSRLTVRMRTDEKEFGVFTNGDSDEISEITRDNYQREEILAAIEAKAIETYGAPKAFSFNGGYGVPRGDYGSEIYDMHFTTFYDGQNLETVLAEERFIIKMDFINCSFENVTEDVFWKSLLKGTHSKIHCLSFRSEDDRQRYHRELSGSLEYNNVTPIGLYMDYSLRDDTDGRHLHDYGLGSYDGFFYSLTDLPAEAVTVETIYESPGLLVGPDSAGKMYETLSPRYRISIADEYQNIINGVKVNVYYPREALKDFEKPVYDLPDLPDVLLFENSDKGFRQVTMLSEYDGLFFFSLLDKDDGTMEFAFATMLN